MEHFLRFWKNDLFNFYDSESLESTLLQRQGAFLLYMLQRRQYFEPELRSAEIRKGDIWFGTELQ